MNTSSQTHLAGRPGTTRLGWILAMAAILATLLGTLWQRPNLDTDAGTCLLAARQKQVGITDQFHTLVTVDPQHLEQPPLARRITWWPPSYVLLPSLAHSCGLDWGRSLQFSFLVFWLFGVVAWLLLFRQLVSANILPWLLLAALLFRSTHAAGYLYEGGELMYWALLPAILLLNYAAIRSDRPPQKLLVIAGFLTPCLVLVKYSAGISALAVGLSWLLLLRLGRVSVKSLCCWGGAAAAASLAIVLAGQLPAGNPAEGDGHLQWAVLAWIPGAWTFAMSDLESLVRFLAVHPDRPWLPAVGRFQDGHIAFLSPLTLLLVGWLFYQQRRSTPDSTSRSANILEILLVSHLVLVSLLLALLIFMGAAIHMDSRFLRPAALAILPILVRQAVAARHSQHPPARMAGIGFLLVLVALPAAYGLGTLAEKTLIRSRTASQKVGPEGVRHDLLNGAGSAERFYAQWRAAGTEETVYYLIDPAMGLALADRRLLIEHAHLRTPDYLVQRQYHGRPAGGVLLAVPRTMQEDGRLSLIQKSFVDVSSWEMLAAGRDVGWILVMGR